MAANGITVGPELICHTLVDNRDKLSLQAALVREDAASENLIRPSHHNPSQNIHRSILALKPC
jgi:hypothetical protein